jgi:hypothetical protein
MTAGESGDTARRAGGLVPTRRAHPSPAEPWASSASNSRALSRPDRTGLVRTLAEATQSPKIAAEAHSPGQRKGDRRDMFSCFRLDMDRPACPASAVAALAHPVESHDNSSVHRLGRTRAVQPTSIMDGKARAADGGSTGARAYPPSDHAMLVLWSGSLLLASDRSCRAIYC